MRVTLTKTFYHDGYWIRVLVALDELGAAIFRIQNDVTISSWCGKWQAQKGWRRAVAYGGYTALDLIQYHHCESAIIHDKERAEEAEEYLDHPK